MATVPSGPAAHNRGDRTDGTDESRTLAYYCELWHLAAVPGLRIRVSTRPREPGYRVVDWTWGRKGWGARQAEEVRRRKVQGEQTQGEQTQGAPAVRSATTSGAGRGESPLLAEELRLFGLKLVHGDDA